MLDTENFQSHSGKAIENQIIFKIIHSPRANVLQSFASKLSQPAFQRLQRQVFNRAINRFEKVNRGFRIVFADDMLKRVNEEKKQSAQSAKLMAGQKRGEIEKINLRLQKLLDAFLDGAIERNDYTAEKAKLMSQKKSLEEQSTMLLTGRANWLEPFNNWIVTARNAGEIAVKGSPREKKVLAQKVFGSNLVLGCKKARGSCVNPWSLLVENSSSGGMVRPEGLEPPAI